MTRITCRLKLYRAFSVDLVRVISSIFFGLPFILQATPAKLGDLDEDAVFTANDLAMLVGHTSGKLDLRPGIQPFADLTQDGFVNDADYEALVNLILESAEPQTLPLASIREISPRSGEGDVAVTRETVLNFSLPLALNSAIDTANFHAEFGGRKILSRVEIASDKKKATLFYLEPLPSNARIRITFNSNGIYDILGRAIDGDNDGVIGGIFVSNFDTLSITPVVGTAISGRVFASEPGSGGSEVPLGGVTVTVDGAEQTLRTTTDAQGNFTLSPCPAGSFFVHIDGRTSPQSTWPNGAYYPSVGKRWDAVAAKSDNLSGNSGDAERGTIYLPLVASGSLQTISQSEETNVRFPASLLASNPTLTGTELQVPANSLVADDGTRGGRVGIAPVSPDRLPSPLPPGLNLPLVITVQTDGATNFDRPVPICFPNLPDPVTGVKLPPGAKSALWSFNHDVGEWEVVGPMTVTVDGDFVKTDAGVGIRQPGWHGTWDGTQGEGAPPGPPPPCDSRPSDNTDALLAKNRRPNPNHNPKPNGCGAEGGQSFPSEFDGVVSFSKACNNHDIGYGTYFGGTTLREFEDHKDEVDRRFYDDMREAVMDGYRAKLFDEERAADYLQLAREYYTAVAIFGWDAYAAGQLDASFWIKDCPEEHEEAPSFQRNNTSEATVINVNPDNLTFYPNQNSFIWITLISVDTGREVFKKKIRSSEWPKYSIRLRSNSPFELYVYSREANLIGFREILSSDSGLKTSLRMPIKWSTSNQDADHDGVTDNAEFITGTNPNNPDTDSDGIADGAELDAGTDPLGGFIAQTGVIASSPTTGAAIDICARNNLAAVACGDAGVAIFNVLRGLNPLRLAELNTIGYAQAVACAGDYVAVADGLGGLAIVDLSDPQDPRIATQIPLGGSAMSVAAEGMLAYVGLDNGSIAVVDLPTGSVLTRFATGTGAIHDLGIGAGFLYALKPNSLITLQPDLLTGGFSVRSTVTSPQTLSPNRRSRLFVGDRYAFATVMKGYNVYSLSDPAVPALVEQEDTTQFGWKQIVSNGSGLALAAVGANASNDGAHEVNAYTIAADGTNSEFLTTFATPGRAEAISLYNGLAYAADADRGLQVISYRPYDGEGQAPTVAIKATFPLDHNTNTGVVVSGSTIRWTALVNDDNQVATVEFLVDGEVVSTDGNFPFGYVAPAPALRAGRTGFTFEARARDTGGNIASSGIYTITLSEDTVNPAVISVFPGANALSAPDVVIRTRFSKAIDEGSLGDGSLFLTGAGPDGAFDTADDIAVVAQPSYRNQIRTAFLNPEDDLDPGLYRINAQPPLSDTAGNVMTTAYSSSFRVYSSRDDDGDEIPDDYERSLGLDPAKLDSNNNGIPDGREDFDKDGLSNAAEFLARTDPTNPDSNSNGVQDGQEDSDADGLTDQQEYLAGTDPRNRDTDGDGWIDEVEVSAGSNPLLAASLPQFPAFYSAGAIQFAVPQQPDYMEQAKAFGATTTNGQNILFGVPQPFNYVEAAKAFGSTHSVIPGNVKIEPTPTGP